MKNLILILFLTSCFKGIGTSVRSVNSSRPVQDTGSTLGGGETDVGGTSDGTTNGSDSSGSDTGGTDSGGGGEKKYKLELMSKMNLSQKGISVPVIRGICANDIWGWTDPENKKEYAILGLTNKTSFIDVTDPSNPIHLADLRSKNGSSSEWRDIKVYKNHALIVSEASNHGLQIFDLTKLRNLDGSSVQVFEIEDVYYNRFGNAHNIVVNEESGFAYAVGATQTSGNFRACDFSLHAINIQDPDSPSFAGCISANLATGGAPGALIVNSASKSSIINENPTFKECIERKTENENGEVKAMHDGTDACGKFYTHDAQCVIYDGPDTDHKGKEICIVSNGPTSNRLENPNVDPDSFHIMDVSDKSNPKLLDTYVITENPGYAHQGWLTKNHEFFIANDEHDELFKGEPNTRTIIIDVRDLDNVKHHMYFRHSVSSIDHNLYVKGDRVYHANYNSGLMVYDISNIENKEYKFLAQYDTNPTKDSAVFEGMWSNYPFFESGTIIASKLETCELLVLKESLE